MDRARGNASTRRLGVRENWKNVWILNFLTI